MQRVTLDTGSKRIPRGVQGGSAEPSLAVNVGTSVAEIVFPDLAEWRGILWRLSISPSEAVEIAAHAEETGIGFQSALLASGLASDDDVYRAVADDLGIGFVEEIDPDRLIVSDSNAIMLLRRQFGQVPVKLERKDGAVSFLLAPERLRPNAMRSLLRKRPGVMPRMLMANPVRLRAAALSRLRDTLSKWAISGLFDRFSDMSARMVANAWQGAVTGIIATVLPAGFLFAPGATLLALHGIATIFFFACVALRFAAASSARPTADLRKLTMPSGEVPVYSIMVALYREADSVPGLVESLDRLVWPRDRLDIKLVCEADDTGTIDAIRALGLPPHFEVVQVPPSLPRTKPKALSYVLPVLRGEIVALYDAEDDPHPMQLIEAWQAFSSAGPDLASVQAPLEISNSADGPLSRLFAFEYAALFRGLLPWLAQRNLVLPLGGTSNHFRRSVLEEVGGWDPFNVTEDADLGLRLNRFGYRAQTIAAPTFEMAPTAYKVWLPQRTRWLKGWMQTWLVHMREPMRLCAEMGLPSFVIAQILLAGMVASALLHPLLIVTAIAITAEFAIQGGVRTFHSVLLMIDVANIFCGYASFLLLGWQTLSRKERGSFWKIVLFTPVYWLMQSRAGWRALWQIIRRPHHWEKTPHGKRPSSLPGSS